jgi:hypothetical protein
MSFGLCEKDKLCAINKDFNGVCLGLSLLSNSLWLSRMMSSYFSCNSCCNSLLARITKQFNGLNVWFLVATSLATEKKTQLQLNLQLNYMNHDVNLMV